MTKAGIYQIKNIINGKIYVGSAVNIGKRWNQHKNFLKNSVHPNKHLQNAWNKYSEKAFVFEILELVENLEQLIPREQCYKDLHKSYDRDFGYDICKAAGSLLGYNHTEEARKKIGKTRVEKGLSKGKNNPNFGGIKEKTKQKMSVAKMGENHPNFGKHPSRETLQKMSIAKIGKHRLKETKQKISKTRKEKHIKSARKLTDEQVLEIRKIKQENPSLTYGEIGEKYNITPSTIHNVIRRKTYVDLKIKDIKR